MKNRILIADDDNAVRESLACVLDQKTFYLSRNAAPKFTRAKPADTDPEPASEK